MSLEKLRSEVKAMAGAWALTTVCRAGRGLSLRAGGIRRPAAAGTGRLEVYPMNWILRGITLCSTYYPPF